MGTAFEALLILYASAVTLLAWDSFTARLYWRDAWKEVCGRLEDEQRRNDRLLAMLAEEECRHD